MDRDVSARGNEDAWRLAALSTMGKDELYTLFSGERAAPWVTAAANAGLPDAQMRLGRMYLSGEGVAQDAAAGFACFARAAESGSGEAHNMLGRCYDGGWGVARSYERAAHHYGIAAEAGDAWARYNLGHLYLDGLGVARDLTRAFELYTAASGQGHVRAMNLVARCYDQGWGVAQDATLAREWYRQSAEGGYFRGAYNYASLLAADGDLQAAALWFGKALATAPEPTRTAIVAALAKSPHAELRALR
jgi:uncharacterized protein